MDFLHTPKINLLHSSSLYLYSLYLAGAFYFEKHNYGGIASYFRKESQSEREHALKIFEYIQKRNGAVAIHSQDPVLANWESHVEVFEAIEKAEHAVTSKIHALADVAEA